MQEDGQIAVTRAKRMQAKYIRISANCRTNTKLTGNIFTFSLFIVFFLLYSFTINGYERYLQKIGWLISVTVVTIKLRERLLFKID